MQNTPCASLLPAGTLNTGGRAREPAGYRLRLKMNTHYAEVHKVSDRLLLAHPSIYVHGHAHSCSLVSQDATSPLLDNTMLGKPLKITAECERAWTSLRTERVRKAKEKEGGRDVFSCLVHAIFLPVLRRRTGLARLRPPLGNRSSRASPRWRTWRCSREP